MNSYRVEVDAEFIRVVENRKVLHHARLTTIAKLIYGTEVRPNFDLLPSGVRWMSSDRRTVMLEREPGIRLMSLVMPGFFTSVPMPYQIMLVTFSEDFTSIERILMGLTAKPRGISSVYDDMRPFYGIGNYEMPVPTTIPAFSANSVGEALDVIFQHCDMQMYKLWAVEPLVGITMPDAAPPPDKDNAYEHQAFVDWWAQQDLDEVVEWTFKAEFITPLQDFINETDPSAITETTLEFFKRVVAEAQAIEEEEERIRQEELRRQEEERQALLNAARPRKKIMLPAKYLQGLNLNDPLAPEAGEIPAAGPGIAASINTATNVNYAHTETF